MALSAGTRLGAYEIVGALGAGGMGEVYRARDTKLNRDVAIKVLLPTVANDPERLARFSREAQVLAALNHPNIAHIYGLEGRDGLDGQEGREGQREATSFIVMELVEGPTLAERIGKLSAIEVTGQPVRALDDVMSNATSRAGQFDVSATGTLLYLRGQSAGGVPLHWMDREGKTTPLQATTAIWFNPQFAPDGRRLAMNIVDGQNDVWVYEWARDRFSRLTFDPPDDRKPVWTPDSRRIVFASARADKSTLNLYWRRADGTGDEQRLTESKNPQQPGSLAYERQASGVRGAEPANELRPDDPGHGGRRCDGLEAWKAHGVPEHALRGARAYVLAGPTMARVLVERNRTR
jgi:hypothetical protein